MKKLLLFILALSLLLGLGYAQTFREQSVSKVFAEQQLKKRSLTDPIPAEDLLKRQAEEERARLSRAEAEVEPGQNPVSLEAAVNELAPGRKNQAARASQPVSAKSTGELRKDMESSAPAQNQTLDRAEREKEREQKRQAKAAQAQSVQLSPDVKRQVNPAEAEKMQEKLREMSPEEAQAALEQIEKENELKKQEELNAHVYLRNAPKQEGFKPNLLTAPPVFRSFPGDDNEIYAWDQNGGYHYKGVLGTPGVMTQLPTYFPNEVQSGEYIEGVLYIADYDGLSDVNRFGTVDLTTGVFTQIGSGTDDGSLDAIGMAWNPVTNKTYISTWVGTALYEINIATGTSTWIGNMGGLSTIAIDNDGICYAIRFGNPGAFGTVNLATGAFTQITSVPFHVNFVQNLSVDRTTNKLYWSAREGTLTSTGSTGLYEVDKATGARTLIGTFASSLSTGCAAFVILTDMADPDAPEAVSGLTATPAALGALSAGLDWTNPTLTVAGTALIDLTAVDVYENSGATPVYSVSSPVIGGTEATTVTVSVAGLYDYKVVGVNSVGEGLPSSVQVWIGPDVPAAPTGVTLVNNSMTATLNWTAPAAGLHGGHFTGAGVEYDVIRFFGATSTTVSTSQTGTTFSEAITQAGAYYYRVVAKNAEGEGGAANSNAEPFCPDITFPWVEDFNSTTFPPVCWQVYQVSAAGNWVRSTGTPLHDGAYAYRQDVSGSNQETWLVTPPITIPSTGVYTLEFMSYIGMASYYVGGSSGGNGRSRVFISTTTDDRAEFTELYFLQGADVSTSWQNIGVSLSAYNSETIYLAFVYTGGYDHNWRIDDVTVYDISSFVDAEVVAITSPAAGANINLTATESVQAVIKNNGGSDLSGFDIILEVNGGTPIVENYSGTLTSGSSDTYTFTASADLSAAGGHTVTVTIDAAGDMVPTNDDKTITLTNAICPIINTFPWIEDFESSTFPPDCWTRYQVSAAGNWVRSTASTWSGANAYRQDVSGSNQETWLVTPPIELPASGVYSLEFMSRIGFVSYYAGNGSGNGRSKVFISTTTAERTEFAELYFLQGSDVADLWQKISVNLNAYLGETIYLAFVYTGNYDHNWRIDDVTVVDMSSYVDAELAAITYPLAGENVNLTATEYVQAVIKNNSGSDLSGFDMILEVNGGTPIVENYSGTLTSGSSDTYTFTAPADLSATGGHTVTVTVDAAGDMVSTNDAKTITLTNVICSPVATFPFTESFGSGIPGCWQNLDADGDGYKWEPIDLGGSIGDVVMSNSYVNYFGAVNPDNWLITLPLALTAGNSYTLTYKVGAVDPDYYADTYDVLVSAGSRAMGSFTSIHSETIPDPSGAVTLLTRTLSLNDYAGQTVYVAFRHWNSTNEYAIMLKDVQVIEIAPSSSTCTITTYPWSESFEDTTFPPTCWTSYDIDGGDEEWERSTVMTPPDGAAAARHVYDWSNQEGWLITPQLSIPAAGNYELTFWTVNDWPEDAVHNGVWVSTTGNNTAAFTLLSDVTLQASETWKKITIPLTAYAGEDIYIGFKYEGAVADNWYIDLVTVQEAAACLPISTFPYIETFDSGIPDCWENIDADGDGQTWHAYLYNDNPMLTSMSWYNNYALFPDNWLITPQIALPAGSSYTLSYKIGATDPAYYWENYSVLISTTGTDINTDFTSVYTEVLPTVDMRTITIPLDAYAGENVYIAFRHHDVYDVFRIVLDDVKVYDPATFVDVDVASITHPQAGTNVNLGSSEDVTVVLVNNGPTPITNIPLTVELNGLLVASDTYTGTIPAAGSVSYAIPAGLDLSAAGSYTIKVTATQSSSFKTVTFTNIICAAVSLPFIETFAGGMPDCWQNIDADGDDYYWIFGTLDGKPVAASQSWDTDGWFFDWPLYPDNWLITPQLVLPAGSSYVLSYTVGAVDPSYYWENYSVLVSTTGTNINTDFTTIHTETLTEGDLKTVVLNLDAYAGESIYIAFRHHDCDDVYMLVLSDVKVYDPATFVDVDVVSITYPTAGVNINLGSSEYVQVMLKNNTAAPLTSVPLELELNGLLAASEAYTGSIPSMGTDTYTFTTGLDLSAAGTYTIKVTATESSDSKTIALENVICSTITAFPFTEDFESTTFPPACWSLYQIAGASNWTRNTTYVQSGLASAYHTYASGDQDTWMVSPTISIPLAGAYLLEFWTYTVDPSYYVYSGVWISTTGSDPSSSTFTEIKQLTGSEVTASWQKISIPLTGYAGEDIHIGFRYAGNFAHGWAVDDVTVYDFSSFVDAEVVAITHPTAGITQNLSATEYVEAVIRNSGGSELSGFDIILEVNGGTPIVENYSGTLTSGSSDTYTFTTSVDLSAAGVHTILVTVDAAGDMVSSNDAKEIAISNSTGTCLWEAAGTAGTITSYQLPINTYYRYSYTQQLFEAADLGSPGLKEITGVAFQYIHTAPQDRLDFTVYLGNTDKSNFASTSDWIPVSEMETVYSGTLSLSDAGPDNWVLITLDSPFTYTGDNLVIAVLDNAGTYYSSSNPTFKIHNTSGSTTLHYRVDGSTPIDPTSPPTATGGLMQRNNVLFEFCEITLCAPTPMNFAASYNASCEAELTWDEPAGGPYSYTISLDGTVLSAAVTGNSYVDNSGFTPLSAHTWTIATNCPAPDEGWPVKVVLPACIVCNPPINLAVVYADDCSEALLSWNSDQFSHSVSDEVVGRIGFGAAAGGDMTVASRFTPADFADAGVETGHSISKIGLGMGTQLFNVTSMEIRIWVGGTSITDPGTLVYTQPITDWTTFAENTMREIELTTPHVIDASQELRIGWNIVNTLGYPFGRDAGPVVAGKGDLIQSPTLFNGDWVSTFAQPELGWNFNYSIKAIIDNPGATYNVYCDGLPIASAITATSLVHPLDPGAHVWDVYTVCGGLEALTPVSVSTNACVPLVCNSPINLTADYSGDCTTALLSWTEPARAQTLLPIDREAWLEKAQGSRVEKQQFTDNVASVYSKEDKGLHATGNRKATGQTAMIRNTAPRASAPTPPRTPRGMVNVTLEAHDVWGDGTGFQLLLDETATQFGLGIPASGALTTSCSGIPATLYDIFSHKIPTAADPTCTSTNIVADGFVTIQIPAGTYDWCIVNPTPGDRLWIVGDGYTPPATTGRRDNYVFEDGYDYHFEVSLMGGGDGVSITTTLAGDPCDAITGLTVNVAGNAANLSWTAPGSAPEHYEVLRNNVSIGTVTTTSYIDNSVPSGQHTYCVKAMYAGTCIPQSVCAAPVIIGDMCNLKIIMYDTYGDGWNGGGITVRVDGVNYGFVTLSNDIYGEATLLIPPGNVEFLWTVGQWDGEVTFEIYNSQDQLIFTCLDATSYLGVFYAWENTCAYIANYAYEITRDGVTLATVETNSYADIGVSIGAHTWTVTTVCTANTQSSPAIVTKDACVLPITSLTISPTTYSHTGSLVNPTSIVVTAGSGALTYPTDYTWAITSVDGTGTSAGTNVGEVTITVTGVGLYSGTL
ncbi:MAG: choice-of-anchor J domain-containing protein, partial [Bacteroidales bacterium]|nr:choice-of-anchor J domain-containing protein [Bacteroidales bacterium]